MPELSGMIGFHLSVLAARKVVNDYLTFLKIEWENTVSKKEMPFTYIVKLLDEFKEYKKK